MRYLKILFLTTMVPLEARDILVEFKTAYFSSSESRVKKIYGTGAVMYGPEVSFKLCGDRNWYGFAAVNYLSKNGRSIGFCNKTSMQLVPISLGLKYFIPVCWGDWYAGLGFQALNLTTKNCSQFVNKCTSKWGFGGVAKVGALFNLSCDWFLDFFIDYNFIKIGREACCKTVPLKVNLDGALFGAGLGYRF